MGDEHFHFEEEGTSEARFLVTNPELANQLRSIAVAEEKTLMHALGRIHPREFSQFLSDIGEERSERAWWLYEEAQRMFKPVRRIYRGRQQMASREQASQQGRASRWSHDLLSLILIGGATLLGISLLDRLGRSLRREEDFEVQSHRQREEQSHDADLEHGRTVSVGGKAEKASSSRL